MASHARQEEAVRDGQEPVRRGLGREVGMLLGTQLAALVLGMASSILVARLLGPAGKGAYTILILYAAVCGLIGSAGVETANTFFRGREQVAPEALLGNTLIVTAGAALLVSVAWPIACLLIARTTSGMATGPMVALAAASVPAGVLGAGVRGILLGEYRIALVCQLRLLQAAASAGLIAVLLVGFGRTVSNALWAAVGSAALCAVVGWCCLSSLGCTLPRWAPTSLSASLLYGARAQVANLLQWANYRIDHFLVGYWLPVRHVGIYSVATGVAGLMWEFPGAVATVLFPRVARQGDQAANAITPKVFRIVAVATLAQALVLGPLARPAITLVFGSAFAPAAGPVLALLPGVVLLSLSKTLCGDLLGRGFPHFGAVASLVGLLATLVLDIALIPRMGIMGAAIASSVSYGLSTILMLRFFLRESDSTIVALTRFRGEELREGLRAARRAIGWHAK